jgi:oxygen-independent coproporphyrinogen-3 oxidase
MPGLYIHIPFCAKKCRYCDFVSFAPPCETERYIRALIKEMEIAAKVIDLRFDTVFFGGGTPSVLPEGMAGLLSEHIVKYFKPDVDAEITIECNPGTINKEKINEYRDSGINRISIGLQSADDRLLERAGRIHNFRQFDETVNLARGAGFTNINADLMSGLPGQSPEDYLKTIETLNQYGLKHISAYSLILEPGTALYEDVTSGREKLPSEDEVCDMQDTGIRTLNGMGFSRYEISNFAVPGYECNHNLNYWRNGEYLGLGVSSHSAMRAPGWTRFENTRDPKQYYSLIESGMLPVIRRTEIGKEEEMFESVMLGLRMVSGVDLNEFRRRFGVSIDCIYQNALDKLYRKGWLIHTDTSIKLTEQGLDMQNAALLEFM